MASFIHSSLLISLIAISLLNQAQSTEGEWKTWNHNTYYSSTTKYSNSSLVNITVSEAPKIVDPVERLNHPEGTNAILTCSIGSGNLNGLIYEWKKDDQLLNLRYNNGKKLRISTSAENDQSTLRIIDLKPEDAGLYTCIAKNIFGQDKASTKLNVKGK